MKVAKSLRKKCIDTFIGHKKNPEDVKIVQGEKCWGNFAK
jgi:hypothetical protein